MKIGKDYTVEGQQCPSCAKVMDAVSGVDHDEAPRPGDVSLCFDCGAVLIFTDTLGLRKPDPMEMLRIELSDDWKRIEKAQAVIRSVPRGKR